MYQRILVPLDGSKHAEHAIPVAARLAKVAGGSLIFVRVVPPPVEFGKYARQHSIAWERAIYNTQRGQAASYLASTMLTHSLELAGLEVEIAVATGITARTLYIVTQKEQADLIVMCGRYESGPLRWLFGSVMREAGRHSPVPVLALREGGATLRRASFFQPLNILVPLDGSPAAEAALVPAVQLARALNPRGQGNLHLLRVTRQFPGAEQQSEPLQNSSLRRERAIQAMLEAENYLQATVDRLRKSSPEAGRLSITTSVRANRNTAKAIIEQAEQSNGCDLIVIARQEQRSLHRLLNDNVTEHILDASRLPLLIVRPHQGNTVDARAAHA